MVRLLSVECWLSRVGCRLLFVVFLVCCLLIDSCWLLLFDVCWSLFAACYCLTFAGCCLFVFFSSVDGCRRLCVVRCVLFVAC